MRFRYVFVGLGSLLTVLLLLMSDPDGGFVQNLPFGSSTLATIIILASSILYIGLLHFARKALFDYIDLEIFFKKALQTPEGSGYALIAVALAMVSISIVILAATK
jgi:multisubunit Na+/H+ antiporter MnhB subunit